MCIFCEPDHINNGVMIGKSFSTDNKHVPLITPLRNRQMIASTRVVEKAKPRFVKLIKKRFNIIMGFLPFMSDNQPQK